MFFLSAILVPGQCIGTEGNIVHEGPYHYWCPPQARQLRRLTRQFIKDRTILPINPHGQWINLCSLTKTWRMTSTYIYRKSERKYQRASFMEYLARWDKGTSWNYKTDKRAHRTTLLDCLGIPVHHSKKRAVRGWPWARGCHLLSPAAVPSGVAENSESNGMLGGCRRTSRIRS